MSFYDLIRDESRLIKGIPILYGLLCLGICAFLFGCSTPAIEASEPKLLVKKHNFSQSMTLDR